MSIYIENYTPSDFAPRGMVNLMRGRGLASASDAKRRVCLIGRTLGEDHAPWALGSDVPVKVHSLNPDKEGGSTFSAEELFGKGSELYLMARAAFRAYPGVELYAMPIDELTETDIHAKATITVTGESKRVGEWTIVLHGKPIVVRIESGSTPAQTALEIAKALNANRELPIKSLLKEDGSLEENVIETGTEKNSPAVLNLTAGFKGKLGERIELFRRGGSSGQSLTIRGFGKASDSPSNLPHTVITDALSALEKQDRFHYIAVANEDYTAMEELAGHLTSTANPIIGKRTQGVMAWTGELADAADMTSGLSRINCPRIQCVWSKGSAMLPGELAAAITAHRSNVEGQFPAVNLSDHVLGGVPRPRLVGDLATSQEIEEALHHGVTPLKLRENGMAVVRSVTTRYLNDFGAKSYELLDTNKVTASDFIADDIYLKMSERFEGYKLSQDSGNFVPAKTVTPQIVQKSIVTWLRSYEKQGIIRQVEENLEQIRVQLGDVDGRIDFEIPESVVNVCAVTAGNLIRY